MWKLSCATAELPAVSAGLTFVCRVDARRWVNLGDKVAKPSARLRAVSAISIFESVKSADSAWTALVRALPAKSSVTDCYRFERGGMQVIAAAVERDGVSSIFARYPERVLRGFSGPLRIKSRVITSAGSNNPTLEMPKSRSPIQCPLKL